MENEYPNNPEALITSREKEVLLQLAKGLTNAQIGVALHISEHTVATHRKNLKRKLKAKTSVDLVKIALRMEKGAK